jgi:hypothetical protein
VERLPFGLARDKRTTDAHSGATTTDFHRVPFLLIRPGIGPNRKATFQILKEQLHTSFTCPAFRLQEKNLNCLKPADAFFHNAIYFTQFSFFPAKRIFYPLNSQPSSLFCLIQLFALRF